jgi:type IV fimbrial biogenesis protein FimT
MLSLLHNGRSAGFSLIELMIGIAIMAIVVSLAMPSYSAWIQNTRIRTAAESIQNGLQVARAEAVRRNARVQFAFGVNSAWTVGCVTVVEPDCPAVIQSRTASEGSSADITVATSDAGPFVFSGLGAMVSPVPAAANGFVSINVDVSTAVLSAAESRELRVMVGIGGSTRMCDPAITSATDPRKCQ